VHLRDTHEAVMFVACRRGQRSGSRAGGPVTFWSGFVLTRALTCLPLDVYVDDERSPRRATLSLGRRCGLPVAHSLPVRYCRSRAEGPGPPETTSRPGDTVVGPFSFAGLERVASPRGLQPYRAAPGYLVTAGANVLAGTRATLVIGRSARGWASLSYATRHLRRVSDGDPAVQFQACPADEPAFSYDGPVGITTGFAGGFILSHPGCVPLEVHAPGRPPVRAMIPFGVDRCARGR
jgi:hypothetical protein